MRSPSRPRRSATVAQLKADIDGGRTMDKVAHPDPAAAPLGTDDEAGGYTPSPEQIGAARIQETQSQTAQKPDRKEGIAILAAIPALLAILGAVLIAG